jgi:hypothetical protein
MEILGARTVARWFGFLTITWASISFAQAQVRNDSCYTLYRNSKSFADMRIHVATFDAEDGEPYNKENCNVAQELFAKQPGVTVKYWCERGRFKK